MRQRQKKFRWKRFILWSLAIVIVLGVSGLFAVNYAVNKVIDSMANSLLEDIDLDASPENNDTGTPSPVDSGNPASPPPSTEGQSSSQEPSKQTADTGGQNGTEKGSDTGKGTGKETGKDTGSKTGGASDQVGEYAPEVSGEKAKAIKDKVTMSEKTDVASILIGNLSLSDIKLLKELASGGMSVDEKRKARKVLLDKLSPEEYNKLSKIAQKYGVSQGKSYDEIQKQEEAEEASDAEKSK